MSPNTVLPATGSVLASLPVSARLFIWVLVIGTMVLITWEIRRSWQRTRDIVLDFFEVSLRPRVFPAKVLDGLGLQRRIVGVTMSAVTVSVADVAYLPDTVIVQVSSADFARLSVIQGGLDRVCRDLAAVAIDRASRRGYEVPERFQVALESSAVCVDGRPRLGHPERAVGRVDDASVAYEGLASTVPATVPMSERRRHAGTAAHAPVPHTRVSRGRSVGLPTQLIGHCQLEPEGGGSPIEVTGRRTVVGREGTDIAVSSDLVSATHAELVCSRGVWAISDLGSTNGTWVNGVQVRRSELVNGDRVGFSVDGPTFVFRRTPVALES